MRVASAVLAVGLLVASSLPAVAHPHIFIDAKATITFNDRGEVASVHNSWTFDEAYSAWSVQGLDTDGDGTVSRAELQPLADDNMEGLAEYGYYTFAGEGAQDLSFVHGSNPTIDYVNGRTVLNFDVGVEHPYAIRDTLELAINDPEYYVAITFADKSDITLVNAPANCSVGIKEGHDMPDAVAQELYALPADVTQLPPELSRALRGVQGAILVQCPGGSGGANSGVAAAAAAPAAPATALDAAEALGTAVAPPSAAPPVVAANAIPFGGPPPEPGLNLPRTGFLGWVAQQQKDFYRGLTGALGQLRSDWTAFWVLGGLSFLYGIFHAAGPGHGKVVISSYVLANERQLRRGVFLSFLSAMLQSAVAIAFVLVAATVLGMSSMAMGEAANWIGIASYGLIVLLGLWLLVRKVFGLGHSHHHHHHEHAPAPAPADMHALALRHLGAPEHALAMPRLPLTRFERVNPEPDAFGRLPGHPHYGHSHGPEHHDGEHHHAHVVTPDQLRGGWREQLGVVLAVGLRPCSGALVVLAFALSQGVLFAGIAAVVLMGLGTAITTGALAALASGAKGLALRFAGYDNRWSGLLLWWAELLGSLAVLSFGVVLLLASL